MKIFARWVLVAIGLFFTQACISSTKEKLVHADAQMLLEQNGFIKQELLDLASLLTQEKIDQMRVDAFVEKYYRRFTRKNDATERWEIPQSRQGDQLRSTIISHFEKLAFFSQIKPKKNNYDYIVVLGATLQSMRLRLGYAKKLWEQGVRAKRIVFLVGDRPLNSFEGPQELADFKQDILPIKKDWHASGSHPGLESELIKELWEQAELPAQLEALPVDLVSAPIQRWPDGSLHRPHTGNTVDEWMVRSPAPGSCLFISNQPFIGYQSAVVRRTMKPGFEIETVGPMAASGTVNVGVLVDSLFRRLAFEAFHCGFINDEKLESYLKQ